MALDLAYDGNRFGRRRLHFSPTYQRKRFLDRGRSVPDTRQFHANGGFESDGVRDLERGPILGGDLPSVLWPSAVLGVLVLMFALFE